MRMDSSSLRGRTMLRQPSPPSPPPPSLRFRFECGICDGSTHPKLREENIAEWVRSRDREIERAEEGREKGWRRERERGGREISDQWDMKMLSEMNVFSKLGGFFSI